MVDGEGGGTHQMKEKEKEKNVWVNRFNATRLMCSPHSKYWHISLSI